MHGDDDFCELQVIPTTQCLGEDRRLMAARCIGELVRKMGERVLAKIIPILRQGMGSPSAATRQGVCAGLKEVRKGCYNSLITSHPMHSTVISKARCL